MVLQADLERPSQGDRTRECEVEDEEGSLVAKVFSTCMVLRGDEARGR